MTSIFFGVAVPVVRGAIKCEARENPISERAVLIQKSVECFDSTYFEMQLFGVFLLDRYSGLLEPEDAGTRRSAEQAGWASGGQGKPSTSVGEMLDAWSTDENFWVRRYSILVLMAGLVRDEKYWERFVRYADSMIEEKEFFI
ncbi:MAG TPA: hypothetical protein EYG09_09700 [Dehalococcoidia bacterium]|nr:hypothetical protein [Dehalococcoidia bacterium]